MMSTEAIIALALIQHGPALARALVSIFQKDTVTKDDWEQVFALYKTPYEAYTKPA